MGTPTTGRTLTTGRTTSAMPTEEHFARNLIGGRWQFPAAPYEYEIRNPSDSTVTAVVPLSSRFDVARAVDAARRALGGAWAQPGRRRRLLDDLLDRLDAQRVALAELQSVETGMALPDSLDIVAATVRMCRRHLDAVDGNEPPPTPGVVGLILSWGAPLVEVLTAALPSLAAGHTVVIKPSLRGPLSPVAFAHLATACGLPDGVVNLVQGTGGDVGADLISRRGLAALQVRAGDRTIAHAERAHQRTGVPLHTLRAGANAIVVRPDRAPTVYAVAAAVAAGLRVNSAGGPFAVPMLALHESMSGRVVSAVLDRLATTVAAPLPTEPLRRRALARVDTLVDAGAIMLLGEQTLPDDISHRMGWRIPPIVLLLGDPTSPAAALAHTSAPLGPVLGIVVWHDLDDLAACLPGRADTGIAQSWGIEAAHAALLPYGLHVSGEAAPTLPAAATLPTGWWGPR